MRMKMNLSKEDYIEIRLEEARKEIEKDAFSYCYDLSEAKISNSINYSHLGTADKGEDNHIGKSVFTGCEKLTKLTVPYISFKWDNSTEGLKKLWYTNEGIYSKLVFKIPW